MCLLIEAELIEADDEVAVKGKTAHWAESRSWQPDDIKRQPKCARLHVVDGSALALAWCRSCEAVGQATKRAVPRE